MRVSILRGVRVIEMGNAWAGPYAARILADLGAEVIKVESPSRPDLVRFSVFLDNDAGEQPWERGAHYQKFSRNKKSCVIDLTKPEGHALFLRLVAISDVFLENNTPRVREQLLLGDEALRHANPDLITLSMPGFGASGPYRNYLAYGLTVEGFSGLSSVTGYQDDPMPVRSAVPYGDPIAAVYGAIAALACLHQRRTTGVGSSVELSQHEALITLLPDALIATQLTGEPSRSQGNCNPTPFPIQGAFQCAEEDAWVAVSVRPEQVPVVAKLVEVKEDHDTAAIAQALQSWAVGLRRDDVVDRLQAAGIAAGPVLSPAEMIEHEQVTARGVYEQVPHPLYRPMPYSRLPIRFHGLAASKDDHAPLFGEHNDYVFTELLGLTTSQVGELYDRGVTATQPDMA